MIFLDNSFCWNNWLIFDIQNWIWKYNFGTFWQTVVTRRNILNIFPWWHNDFRKKNLFLRTHHLWNSTTELILLYPLWLGLSCLAVLRSSSTGSVLGEMFFHELWMCDPCTTQRWARPQISKNVLDMKIQDTGLIF